MGTLVCLHAHPDDECIGTGGTIARASAEGHRVVLVVATNGDFGEVPDDLAEGETLMDRRRDEVQRSAAVLGLDRIAWLGYKDSGMTGWEQNADPKCLHQADLEEAAERFAAILREEHADVVTTYDWHGTYGHPDHVKVHHVAHRGAELAGVGKVFDATMNRSAMQRFAEAARDSGTEIDFDPDGPSDDGNPFGEPEDVITYAVDVTPYLSAKRESLRCHASQVTDSGFFMNMAEDVFALAFGTEYFVDATAEPGMRPGWLFD